MRFVLGWLLGFGLSAHALGNLQIDQIFPPHRILVSFEDVPLSDLKPEQLLMIRSRTTNQIIGYARILEIIEEPIPKKLLAEVSLHERSELIIPGDHIEIPNLATKVDDLEGRGDLFVKNKREYSARYKRLAWFGLFLGDGHALGHGETLIDFTTTVMHGITESLTAGTVVLADLAIPNLMVKYTIVDTPYLTITPSVTGWFAPTLSASGTQVRMLMSTSVNTKLISHSSLSFARNVPGQIDPKYSEAFLRTEFRSGFEFVLDSWDRILFGPLYNFDYGTAGAYAEFLLIWDHFHLGLGAQTQDFTLLKFDPSRAYSAQFTAFWRF